MSAPRTLEVQPSKLWLARYTKRTQSPAACTCAAQSALQLVHMKILEGDEPNPITGGFVCRILCCNTQAGSVIGK